MASGWPLSEAAARRQRRKRKRAAVHANRICFGGLPGLLGDPAFGWGSLVWGSQAEDTHSPYLESQFTHEVKSTCDEFMEQLRQTFSEALKLIKAGLAHKVNQCQVVADEGEYLEAETVGTAGRAAACGTGVSSRQVEFF